MKKILINKCYGGYSLSEEFIDHLKTINLANENDNTYSIERDNQEIVEEAIKFGLDKASGMCANLTVIEIPEKAHYYIDEYDGIESIQEIWINVTIDDLKNGLSEEQLNLVTNGCSVKLQS